MSQAAKRETSQRPSRTWVLWVVRTALALTVIIVSASAIASIWMEKLSSDSIWWLVYAMPQVTIALLAVLLCWDRDSRPEGSGITTGVLNMFGIVFAVIFMRWLPMLVGALTILAMVLRPREWIYSGTPPPRFVWLRSLWSRLVRR